MKLKRITLWNDLRICMLALLFLTFIAGTVAGEFNITFIPDTPADSASLNQTYADINTSVNATNGSTAFIDWNRSLIGWWRLNNESDENSSFFRDRSTWGNNGTCSPIGRCPDLTSGKFGNASNFNSSATDYIEMNSSVSLNSSNITLETWFKVENFSDPIEHPLIHKAINNSNGTLLYMLSLANTSGSPISADFYLSVSGVNYWVEVHNLDYNDSQWHYLAGTYNGSTMIMYLDGNAVGNNATPEGPIASYDTWLEIGKRTKMSGSSWDYFNGSIDEVRIHDRALSPEEINASYNATNHRLHNNFTGLGYGTYNYTAYAQNENGNISQTTRTLTLAAAGAQAPNINSSSPASPVTDTVGASRTFNITVDQTVNVRWYMNGTLLGNNSTNVMSANYTNTSAVVGTWNVTAVANNSNGTVSKQWNWTVSATVGAPTISSFAPPSPVNDTPGANRTFNITVNQIVNVSWYINGTLLGSNSSTNVTNANYTNASASVGTWNVTAVANNSNGTVSKQWNWTVSAAGAQAPNINSSSPASSVTNNSGASIRFDINVDQIVNVSWYLNGTLLASNSSTNVTTANYTNASAVSGIWNVTAIVNNSNGTDQNVWTWTVRAPNGTKLTADQLTQTVSSGVTATYTITLENNGSSTDNYTVNYSIENSTATVVTNLSNVTSLVPGNTRTFFLNVSSISAGTFPVNVTANSTNDITKVSYVNTTTTVTSVIAPPVITIGNPANNSVNTTGYVNVTATLSDTGIAQYLNWDGVNYSMTPATAQTAGTVFYRNMTGLLSGDHTFRIFGNNSGASNTSGIRVVTVNRTTDTSIAGSINTTTFIVNTTIVVSAPSGNVTVTIPNGTNASVSGSAITNLSMDSLARVNSTFTLGNNTLIGENLSAGPEGARFSPDIQIRFNYTHAQLSAAGINESQLRIKFYNTSLGVWVEQTPYTLNTTVNFITANVSHFSTFALAAQVTGAPNITGFAPSATVTDIVGASRRFNITVDQTVNVSWYLNGILLSNTSAGVTTANYTNASASAGTWNVTASATNSNGTDQNVWTWTVSAASGAPTISSSAPESPVRDLIGAIRTFNITFDQTVNVSWYLNGTSVQNNTSVPSGTMVNYTNSSALSGIWNVTAVANNSNGTVSKQWTWTASDTILTLKAGWNLVSVPFSLSNTRPFTGFTVLTYNASAAIPVSDPAIEPLKSYWVNNSGNETTVALFKATADGSSGGSGAPTKSISLANGWNMVGPTGNVSMNASEMFGSIGLNLWRVASYNSTGDAYVIFTNSDTAVNKVSDLVTGPTVGYWAFVTRDSMYDGDGSIR